MHRSRARCCASRSGKQQANDWATASTCATRPTSFAADAPFHIEHGFSCGEGDNACKQDQLTANADFDLYLDGVLQPSTVDVDRDPDGSKSRLHLTNYPSGLPAGTYTFDGVWSLNGTIVQERTKTITFS